MKTARLLAMLIAVRLCALADGVLGDTFGSGSNTFDIEFVTIGNPGNVADATGNPNPAGSVAYSYRIGAFEVSGQMIDKANVLGGLGITREPLGPDKPATSVTWFEAATFVNWLNTSTGHMPAYKFNEGNFELWKSEDAGYSPSNLFRNNLAKYSLPSVDEWHKAAYYDPASNVYYDYPTGSNTPPIHVSSGTGPDTAVLCCESGPADVMQAGGLSPFGTMGQGGNVYEWEETDIDRHNDSTSAFRGIRGGSYTGAAEFLAATVHGRVAPTHVSPSLGFRVAAALPNDSLFYSTGGFDSPGREVQHVRRADLDGTNDATILTNSLNPNGYFGGVDIDPVNRYLYGVTMDAVFRANLDGSHRTTITSSPGPSGEDIELDLVNGRVYWSAANSIWRSNLDGSAKEAIIPGPFGTSQGIALDVAAGKIYFAISESGQIRVANLDGAGVSTFVQGASLVGDVEFDPVNNMIYWAQSEGIRRTTAGTVGPIETLVDFASIGGGSGSGIDFDSVDQALYFTYGRGSSPFFSNFGPVGIARINADGSGFQPILQNVDAINYVRAAHPISLSTPGSINFADAAPDDAAFFAGTRSGNGGVPAPPVTITLASLDLLNGSSFTLAPNETLELNGGTLFIGQGAVFTGNGVIRGHVINAGLLRIPIVRVPIISQTTGGHVQVELPESTAGEVVIDISGGASGFGVGGGTLLSFDFRNDAPVPVVIQGDPAPNEGTIRFDASLEITGSYQQRETGALRLFIGGDSLPGESYSQLIVGEGVTLAGALEIVFDPTLFREFGYAPRVGDSFDLIVAGGGIAIADTGLELLNFVTAAGAPLVSGVTLASYDSGIAADPDNLMRIDETLFRIDLVENDTILRATLVQPIHFVPEPAAAAMLVALTGGVSHFRRPRCLPHAGSCRA